MGAPLEVAREERSADKRADHGGDEEQREDQPAEGLNQVAGLGDQVRAVRKGCGERLAGVDPKLSANARNVFGAIQQSDGDERSAEQHGQDLEAVLSPDEPLHDCAPLSADRR